MLRSEILWQGCSLKQGFHCSSIDSALKDKENKDDYKFVPLKKKHFPKYSSSTIVDYRKYRLKTFCSLIQIKNLNASLPCYSECFNYRGPGFDITVVSVFLLVILSCSDDALLYLYEDLNVRCPGMPCPCFFGHSPGTFLPQRIAFNNAVLP